MHEEPERRQIAARIANTANEHEREALLLWIVQLLQVRDSSLSSTEKAKQAVVLTAKRIVIWPMVKLLTQEIKRVGWNERGTKSRYGIAGAGIGLALFGTQGAGIAALGGAIGVPLWVAFWALARISRRC